MKKLTIAGLPPRFAASVIPTSCIAPQTATTPRALGLMPQRPLRGLAGGTFPVLSDVKGASLLAVITDRVIGELRLRFEDLRSRSREQRIEFARQLAMHLCRKIAGAPFESIEEHFNRDHSTVIHAYRLIERRMARYAAFRLFIAKLEGKITRTMATTGAAAA